MIWKLNLHLGLSHHGQSSSDLKENKNKNIETQKNILGKWRQILRFPSTRLAYFQFGISSDTEEKTDL